VEPTNPEQFFKDLSPEEIVRGIEAAERVLDERISRSSDGGSGDVAGRVSSSLDGGSSGGGSKATEPLSAAESDRMADIAYRMEEEDGDASKQNRGDEPTHAADAALVELARDVHRAEEIGSQTEPEESTAAARASSWIDWGSAARLFAGGARGLLGYVVGGARAAYSTVAAAAFTYLAATRDWIKRALNGAFGATMAIASIVYEIGPDVLRRFEPLLSVVLSGISMFAALKESLMRVSAGVAGSIAEIWGAFARCACDVVASSASGLAAAADAVAAAIVAAAGPSRSISSALSAVLKFAGELVPSLGSGGSGDGGGGGGGDGGDSAATAGEGASVDGGSDRSRATKMVAAVVRSLVSAATGAAGRVATALTSVASETYAWVVQSTVTAWCAASQMLMRPLRRVVADAARLFGTKIASGVGLSPTMAMRCFAEAARERPTEIAATYDEIVGLWKASSEKVWLRDLVERAGGIAALSFTAPFAQLWKTTSALAKLLCGATGGDAESAPAAYDAFIESMSGGIGLPALTHPLMCVPSAAALASQKRIFELYRAWRLEPPSDLAESSLSSSLLATAVGSSGEAWNRGGYSSSSDSSSGPSTRRRRSGARDNAAINDDRFATIALEAARRLRANTSSGLTAEELEKAEIARAAVYQSAPTWMLQQQQQQQPAMQQQFAGYGIAPDPAWYGRPPQQFGTGPYYPYQQQQQQQQQQWQQYADPRYSTGDVTADRFKGIQHATEELLRDGRAAMAAAAASASQPVASGSGPAFSVAWLLLTELVVSLTAWCTVGWGVYKQMTDAIANELLKKHVREETFPEGRDDAIWLNEDGVEMFGDFAHVAPDGKKYVSTKVFALKLMHLGKENSSLRYIETNVKQYKKASGELMNDAEISAKISDIASRVKSAVVDQRAAIASAIESGNDDRWEFFMSSPFLFTTGTIAVALALVLAIGYAAKKLAEKRPSKESVISGAGQLLTDAIAMALNCFIGRAVSSVIRIFASGSQSIVAKTIDALGCAFAAVITIALLTLTSFSLAHPMSRVVSGMMSVTLLFFVKAIPVIVNALLVFTNASGMTSLLATIASSIAAGAGGIALAKKLTS
jgi:hypothetical protein